MINEPTQIMLNPSAGTPWRTKAQIAEHYRCHLKTVTSLMRRRILPFVKIRRLVRLNVVECDQAMEKFKRRSDLL
jgi:hypothetical protein